MRGRRQVPAGAAAPRLSAGVGRKGRQSICRGVWEWFQQRQIADNANSAAQAHASARAAWLHVVRPQAMNDFAACAR